MYIYMENFDFLELIYIFVKIWYYYINRCLFIIFKII